MAIPKNSSRPLKHARRDAAAFMHYMPMSSKEAGSPSDPEEGVLFKIYGWDEQLSNRRPNSTLQHPFFSRVAPSDRVPDRAGGLAPLFFPSSDDNCALCLGGNGANSPLAVLAIAKSPDQDFFGIGSAPVCFPFYVYDPDAAHRRENITDWALDRFRSHYNNPVLSKWSIFDYVYGILHHRGYLERFAGNLKRELPRIPFAPDFRAFQRAGQELIRLHLDYEKLEPMKLKSIESPAASNSSDRLKMKLSKDKTALALNDSLTLGEIPPAVFDYRLGNRSALEWVIDEYQVHEDPKSKIESDPNRQNDSEYIARLVGQVVRVSVETVRIARGLPKEFAEAAEREEKP